MHKREEQVSRLVHFIEARHPSDLCGYNGTDFDYILALLQDEDACAKLAQSGRPEDYNSTAASAVEYVNESNNTSNDFAVMADASNTSVHQAMHEGNRTRRLVRRASGAAPPASYDCEDDDDPDGCASRVRRKMHFHDEHDILREIAHGLHFASIAILAFLVLEVSQWFCQEISSLNCSVFLLFPGAKFAI
jgi:hypothetical protein